MISEKLGSSEGPPASVPAQEQNDNVLTEAQREFAKVLGELLARRWQEERAQEAGRLEPKDK